MTNDGGPAFPQPQIVDGRGAPTFPWDGYGMGGMSLRDWFAGKATEADIQNWLVRGECDTREEAKYLYADAMLKAREEQA